MAQDMFLTNQALGAVMMALQRALMNQEDVTELLKKFKFRLSEQGLVVLNPPTFKVNEEESVSTVTE